jgi:hypothetical protein
LIPSVSAVETLAITRSTTDETNDRIGSENPPTDGRNLAEERRDDGGATRTRSRGSALGGGF